jgi:hypothetical protein
MKVFLGWSGEISKLVAQELHEWLQDVIQNIEPWMSSEDISKGARWTPAIAKELAESRAGIFCLTPDNLGDPWLHFEAGAVSNTAWSASVCTYLFGVTSSGLTGPLTQFQGTVATSKQDNLKMLSTINSARQEGALDQKRLEKAFNTHWPALEQKLTQVSKAKTHAPSKRPVEDMVEETLNIVRDLQKQSAKTPKLQPAYYTVESPPFAPHPATYYDALAALGSVGSASGNIIFPGGSSDDPTGHKLITLGKPDEPGPQGPRSTIQLRKSNNPKEK